MCLRPTVVLRSEPAERPEEHVRPAHEPDGGRRLQQPGEGVQQLPAGGAGQVGPEEEEEGGAPVRRGGPGDLGPRVEGLVHGGDEVGVAALRGGQRGLHQVGAASGRQLVEGEVGAGWN